MKEAKGSATRGYRGGIFRGALRWTLFAGLLLMHEGRGVAQQVQPPDVEGKVHSLLIGMTLEQKLKLVGGDGMYTFAVPEIGLATIKMSDGPAGVRTWGPSNAYPVGLALAATWDPAMAVRQGEALGDDAKARGVSVLLAPGVNMYRAPMNGRNFEYFGEDPYLSSRMAVGYIEGVQSRGVAATVKHFDANNSEFDRHNTNDVIDERTLREIYLPAFESAVKEAHVAAVMDSYNLVNGLHMTQNGPMNNDILKQEWGFDGVIMSDWTATYDGVAAANGGLDLEMPRGKLMTPETLGAAIKSGSLSMTTLDDHVRRILRLAVRYGLVDGKAKEATGPLYSLAGQKVAYDAAAESVVLLKNDNHVLPLDIVKTHRIAVLGPNAYPAVVGGGGSSYTTTFASTDLYTSLSEAAAPNTEILYSPGLRTEVELCAQTKFDGGLRQETFNNPGFTGEPQLSHVQGVTQWAPTFRIGGPTIEHEKSYRWKGRYTATKDGGYLFLLGARSRDIAALYVDKEKVLEHFAMEGSSPKSVTLPLKAGQVVEVRLDYVQRNNEPGAGLGIIASDQLVLPEAQAMAAKADAVIVDIGLNQSYESEGFDRPWKLLPGQNELVEAAIASNPRTIVVLNGGGSMDISAWVDRLPGLLHAWYGGEEGGKALTDIILGKVNPSGKLPISFERRFEDDATFDSYYPKAGTVDVPYTEGIFLGYRHFDRSTVKPLFPFGYGLSYTTFSIRNLSVNAAAHDHVRLTFEVRNTGQRSGDEVAEVYVGEVQPPLPRPVKELKAFQRVHLLPGASEQVSVTLNARAFSYWDTATHAWKRDNGQYRIFVGDSSVSVPLQRTIELAP